MAVDNSTLKGRKHMTAHIRSLVHNDRNSWWYRRNKPDHARSLTDDYMYAVVNATPHDDIADQETHPYSYSGHPFERVDDNPDQWELIGQIPIAIFNIINSIVVTEDMQLKVLKARAVCSYDYPVKLDDRIIQLQEGVSIANRIEWKVDAIRPRAGQYWSMDVIGLVGRHG